MNHPAVLFLSINYIGICAGARTLAGMFLATCQLFPIPCRPESYQPHTFQTTSGIRARNHCVTFLLDCFDRERLTCSAKRLTRGETSQNPAEQFPSCSQHLKKVSCRVSSIPPIISGQDVDCLGHSLPAKYVLPGEFLRKKNYQQCLLA